MYKNVLFIDVYAYNFIARDTLFTRHVLTRLYKPRVNTPQIFNRGWPVYFYMLVDFLIILIKCNAFSLNFMPRVSNNVEIRVTCDEKLCHFISNFLRLTMTSAYSEESLIENVRAHTSLYYVFSFYLDLFLTEKIN